MNAKSVGLSAPIIRACVVPALLLASACTSAQEKPQGDWYTAKPPAKSGDSPLKSAALVTGDLPGYQVSTQKNPAAPAGRPTADTPRCQALADVMGDRPSPDARDTVNRGLGSQKRLGLAISASLSSYAPDHARRLLADLRAAVAACRSGFTATLQGQSGRYSDVRAVSQSAAGDEIVSWTTTGATKGFKAPIHMVVIRSGSTVARFMALDIADRTDPRVPTEVIDKQLEKVSRMHAD